MWDGRRREPAGGVNTVVVELTSVSVANPLPFLAEPPLACCAVDDRLYVLARDRARGWVRGVALDARALCNSSQANLPLAYVTRSAAVDRDTIVVTGAGQDGDAVAVVVGVDWTMRWRVTVPVEGQLAVWPFPCGGGDEVRLVWEDATGLQVGKVIAESVHRLNYVESGELDGTVTGLDAVGDESGLTVVRAFTDPPGVEFLRFVDGEPTLRHALPGVRVTAPALVRLGQRHLLIWISPSEPGVRRQFFGLDLSPLGPAVRVFDESPSAGGMTEAPQSLRLFAGDNDRLAVGWHTAKEDHRARVTLGEWVAALDPTTGVAGVSHALADPGPWYGGGGWLGDHLLVLHGAAAPLVSVFQATGSDGETQGEPPRKHS